MARVDHALTGLCEQYGIGRAFGFLEVGCVRRHRRCGGGGNGVSYDWNQRPWQADNRPPTNTNRVVIGIVCAAAVFLLSSTLLLALGAPQALGAVFRPSTALAVPTSTTSQESPDATVDDSSPSATPDPKATATATLVPGAPVPSATAAKATATKTPTRTATATATATPAPAPMLSLNFTSVDAGSCSAPSTTPVMVSNTGGGSMVWSSNSSDGATASPTGDTLGANGSESVTITWSTPLTSGSTIQFTANGSVSSVTVTGNCAAG